MLHVYAVSDAGRVRGNNEDCFLAGGIVEKGPVEFSIPQGGLFLQRYGLLCAVADGMGGHSAGEVASCVALGLLATSVFSMPEDKGADSLYSHISDVIRDIHEYINSIGERESALRGMGTTLTGFFLTARTSIYFHAGDSRLYRYRGGGLMQLTTDHSVEHLNMGPFSLAGERAKSGVIYNALGGGAGQHCEPEVKPFDFRENDICMLCTDGLSDMLALEEMEMVFRRGTSLKDIASGLLSAAYKAGGEDNITIMLVESQKDAGDRAAL